MKKTHKKLDNMQQFCKIGASPAKETEQKPNQYNIMTTTHNTTTMGLAAMSSEAATAFEQISFEPTHSHTVQALQLITESNYTALDAAQAIATMQQTRDAHYADYSKGLISCYVGTYGKYNSGSLDGIWVCLDDYTDAESLLEDFARIHGDEADPEIMLQDWNITLDGLTASDLGECPDTDTLQFLLDLLQADEDERELALDYLQATGGNLSHYSDFSDLLRTAEDLRVGWLDPRSWNPFRDYVEETFMELYGHEIPDSLTGYIDFDRMARDWEFDHTVGEKFVFMH